MVPTRESLEVRERWRAFYRIARIALQRRNDLAACGGGMPIYRALYRLGVPSLWVTLLLSHDSIEPQFRARWLVRIRNFRRRGRASDRPLRDWMASVNRLAGRASA